MAKFDYRCPMCKATLLDIQGALGNPPEIACQECQTLMVRYFGAMQAEEVVINYGFRESRYSTKTDADIAKFQFQNL